MQHPPPPRLPVFAFEAPLANDDMPPLEPPIAPHPNPFILEQPLPPQQPAEPIQNDALPDLQPRPRRAVQPAARRARQPRNGNNNLGNDNDAFNLNVNAELGPDGLAVDIQAQGDVNAFMELVGIQGPIDLLFQNFALALFIVFAALGAGGWVPFVCGKLILWLFFDVYSVAVGEVMEKGIGIISKVTDPILDPVVDGLVVLVKWSGLVAVSNATLAAVVNGTMNNATVEVLREPVVVEAVPSSADEKGQLSPGLKDVMDQIEKGSENGRKMPLDSVTVSITLTGNVTTNGTIVESFDHSKPSQRFEFVSDRIANIVVGYLTIIFVAYHQAVSFQLFR
ncbi:hypothetical protein HDU99_006127 [Rhizoclosmatium hyalinum]|nr:hypothetical protein HDU99_006127 [Rhizoclosmatium hyalinum]